MQKMVPSLVLLIALSGCSTLSSELTGIYSGPMPPASNVCQRADYQQFSPSHIVGNAFPEVGNLGNDLPIVSASYQNGVYLCEYSVEHKVTTQDETNTYIHDRTEVIGIAIKPDLSNSQEMENMMAEGSIGFGDVPNPTYSIYQPRTILNDNVTTVPNATIATQQNEEATEEKNAEEEEEQYDRDHPCVLYNVIGTNGIIEGTRCVARR